MNKTLFIGCIVVTLFIAAYSFAQTGGGMPGGQQGQAGGVEKGPMMEHSQMMNGMINMSNRMSAMMGKMSGTMKDMPADRMKQMSPLMKDMSQHMMEMARIMEKGKVPENVMKNLHERMNRMEKMMSDMEKKK
jgi:hypothetical protein